MSSKPSRKAKLRQRIQELGRSAAIGLGTGVGVVYLTYRQRIRRLEDPSWSPSDGADMLVHVFENTMAQLGHPGHWHESVPEPEVVVHDSHWVDPRESDVNLH